MHLIVVVLCLYIIKFIFFSVRRFVSFAFVVMCNFLFVCTMQRACARVHTTQYSTPSNTLLTSKYLYWLFRIFLFSFVLFIAQAIRKQCCLLFCCFFLFKSLLFLHFSLFNGFTCFSRTQNLLLLFSFYCYRITQ